MVEVFIVGLPALFLGSIAFLGYICWSLRPRQREGISMRTQVRATFAALLFAVGFAVIAAPAAQEDPLTVLRAERSKYGAQLDTAQAGALLDATASRLGNGWGLLRKTGGNRCPQPGTGIDVSCDWLVNRNTGLGCDALGSGPDNENGGHTGPSNPQWCAGDPFDKGNWVAPTGGTTPPPPPPPPDTEVMRLLVEMNRHQQEIMTQLDQIARAISAIDAAARLSRIEDDVNAIRNKAEQPVVFPPYTGRVLGQPFTLTPKK